jgi:hypothetical protein
MPPSVSNLTFIIVEKSGSLKEVSTKEINVEEMYKKCGFRKSDDFECRTTWENVQVGYSKHTVQLWARSEGKANTENKYDFPPPVDTNLFFGNCALVQVKNGKYISLTKEAWLKIYETLFGGFEDIENEKDDEEIDELENIKKEMKTKKGEYLKDGFVVDTDESEEVVSCSADSDEEELDDEEDEDEDDQDNEVGMELEDDELDISVGSELEEEEYEYSDD